MGTIAARDCQRVLELTEQVAAAALLAGAQALQIRLRDGGLEAELPTPLARCVDQVSEFFPFLSEDRELEPALRAALQSIVMKRLEVVEPI